MILQIIGMIALIGFGAWVLAAAFAIFVAGQCFGSSKSEWFVSVLFAGLGSGAIYLACKLSPFTVVVQS